MARTPVSYGTTDFFKSFIKKHPKANISKKVHAEILSCGGDVISEFLLDEGEFKLFGRLGKLMIRLVKPKGQRMRMIDFNQTRKTGKNVYHFNDHSDGYVGKFVWDRKECVLSDKFMWNFRRVRKIKRQLAHAMKSGKQYPLQMNVK